MLASSARLVCTLGPSHQCPRSTHRVSSAPQTLWVMMDVVMLMPGSKRTPASSQGSSSRLACLNHFRPVAVMCFVVCRMSTRYLTASMSLCPRFPASRLRSSSSACCVSGRAVTRDRLFVQAAVLQGALHSLHRCTSLRMQAVVWSTMKSSAFDDQQIRSDGGCSGHGYECLIRPRAERSTVIQVDLGDFALACSVLEKSKASSHARAMLR